MTLQHQHPAQLLLGAVIVGEELATRNRQMTFASLCHDALTWATETRDLLCEIAREAEEGERLVLEVAQDGKISREETRRLRGAFHEIYVEARDGRVVP